MTPYLLNFNTLMSPDQVEGMLGIFAAMNNSG